MNEANVETTRRDGGASSAAGPRRAPRVAVVLLNWNNWADTRRCLEALRQLGSSNHTTVTVDNGSADESVPRLREAFPESPVLENGANFGFARGCNVGIRWALARGADYVWLLNNDTVPDARALGQMIELAESDAGLGAVGGVLVAMDQPDTVQEWGGGWFNPWLGTFGVFPGAPGRRRLDYLCGGCLLLRRSALESVGLLDEGYFMYGEDCDLCLRLRKAGWRLAVAPAARVRHRLGASMPSLTRLFYVNAAAARTLRKHAPFPALAMIAGAGRRSVRSVLTGRWGRAAAILGGTWAGWRAYRKGVPYTLPRRYTANETGNRRG